MDSAALRRRPEGVDEDTAAAVGKVTEALEKVERARGRLYDFHQLIGSADEQLCEAVAQLRRAGQEEAAERLESVLVGRNVLPGRWTFQVVEEFDDGYWESFRAEERRVRQHLCAGQRHVHEAELKERERSVDADGNPLPGHEAGPGSEAGPGAGG
ncbi:hypothetical protein GCM10027174_12670 [Salinifilum aidingensis]